MNTARWTMLVFAAWCMCQAGCVAVESPRTVRFSVRPYGEYMRLKTTKPQTGGGISQSLRLPDFREMTIGQGSAQQGNFDTIRIFRNGTGYAIAGKGSDQMARVPISLTAAQMHLLLDAMNRDELASLRGVYSSGVFDGATGFVEVVSHEGRVSAWLDNYFEVVKRTFAFCNEQVWPQVDRALSTAHFDHRINGLAECDRVMKGKR